MRSHGAEALAARRTALQIRRRQAGENKGGGSERRGAVLLLHGSGDSGAAILSWCIECGMAAALCARKLTLHALDAPWRRFSPAGGELWRVSATACQTWNALCLLGLVGRHGISTGMSAVSLLPFLQARVLTRAARSPRSFLPSA